MSDSTTRPLKVFLCHSSADKPTVRELYRQLTAEGWIDTWLDEVNLLPGQEWDIEIERAVEEVDIVLVCLSTRSVDKEGYVQKELRFVLNIADEKPEGSIFVIPLRLDDCSVPRRLRHWQWVDYFPENQRRLTYERLLESLRVRARKLGIPFKGSESKSDEFKHEETTKQQGQLLQSQPVDATNKENYANHISSSLPEHKSYEQRSVNAGPNARLIRVVLGIFVLLALIFSVWAIPLLRNNAPSNDPQSTNTIQPTRANSATLSLTSVMMATSVPAASMSGITSEKDGMILLPVPAGKFTMGSNKGTLEERPEHTLDLDAFWVDKTEVTVEMYSACVSAGVCQDKSPFTQTDYLSNAAFNTYPMILVSWEDANTYCEWVGRRLPTEAEWEKAARGENGFIYPWGNDFDGARVNFCDQNCSVGTPNPSFNDGFAETAPVGSYLDGASPYGALDMAGNIWELVADWYDAEYYAGSPDSNPPGPESGKYRVMRGGSWVTHLEFGLRSSYRSYLDPDIGNHDIGFRCAMSATP